MFENARNRFKDCSTASDKDWQELQDAKKELNEAETELNHLRAEVERLSEYKQLTEKLLKAVNAQTITSWSAMGIIERTLENMGREQKDGGKVEA